MTVYERDVEGRVLDFGVSGLLYNSNLVMYDRQTETLWSHFTGESLYGELGGADLVAIPSTIAGFGSWVEKNPDDLVLNQDTGVDRNHGANPYPGYDSIDNEQFLFEGEVDGRFTAMTRVVGVESPTGDAAAAFPSSISARPECVSLRSAMTRSLRSGRRGRPPHSTGPRSRAASMWERPVSSCPR